MSSESWLIPDATNRVKEIPRKTNQVALARAITHEKILSTGWGTLKVRLTVAEASEESEIGEMGRTADSAPVVSRGLTGSTSRGRVWVSC